MTCEEAREQLMGLESSAFHEVRHLATCEGCRAFAAELRAMDTAVVEHIEAHARAGDFTREWDRALRASRRRLRPAGGVALTALALAAAALLVVRVLPEDPGFVPEDRRTVAPAPVTNPPTTAPPSPPAPAPPPGPAPAPPPGPAPAPTPAPAPSPPPASAPPPLAPPAPSPPQASAPSPAPSPPQASSPSPPQASAPSPSPARSESVKPRAPKSARRPIRAAPSPAAPEPPPVDPAAPMQPTPAASRPVDATTIVVTVAPDVAGFASAELGCGSSNERQERVGDQIRFEVTQGKRCRLSFPGEALRGTVTPGEGYRVVLVDGRPALRPE